MWLLVLMLVLEGCLVRHDRLLSALVPSPDMRWQKKIALCPGRF